MEPNKRRKYKRFCLERELYYHFPYEFSSKVHIQSHQEQSCRHKAQIKNVSTEGLCFHTSEHLHEGDDLDLEVFIPGLDEPVNLRGEVSWINQTPEDGGFDTGVKLIQIEGKPVKDSIYFDQQYGVYWSDVLESILGKFRILEQEKKSKNS